MTKLNKLKYHFNYAKQVGDKDIQLTYLNKIKDYFAEEIYGEFGYDTCHKSEQEFIDTVENCNVLEDTDGVAG